MIYKTTRFGDIDIPDDKIIFFPSGIIGFENENKFVILKHKPDSSFFWIQSLTTKELAFSSLFPSQFIPGYKPVLNKTDLKNIGAEKPEELEFYCMVVIPKDPSKLTINLLSPLVINPKAKLGMQVILENSGYSVDQRLIPDNDEKAEKAG